MQNQPKPQLLNQQQKRHIQNQEEQGHNMQIQEEPWQIQRRRHPKPQEQANTNAVWRPVNPPAPKDNSTQQQEQESVGIPNLPTQNFFTNLEVQETQPTRNSPAKQNNSQQYSAGNTKSKSTGIDLSLPSPQPLYISDVNAGFTDEVEGGMDGGCQEIATNLQEGESKGGNLPHAMHEGLDHDHRTAHRATRNAEGIQQHKQQIQQQMQNSDNKKQDAKETIEEKGEKQNDSDHEKKKVTMVNESSPKSRNKPSKPKRDAAKRRQIQQQEKDMEQEHEVREELCNKFVMVDDTQGLNILPLQVQYMAPHSSDPPDKMHKQCRLNDQQNLDEYGVINSEDDQTDDNHSLQESDDNDESSEALIRAFNPHKEQIIEDEVQQVIKNQSLSPRNFQQNRFHFTKQDANTATAGRPNTRLFSSRSSQ
ncbi:uncharacterized protein [Solanum lycopersicum]|uniref:uncharacterized protein n=1 Tax=Solanum lycopersicum TaxID=4081 RepID=UPI003749B742